MSLLGRIGVVVDAFRPSVLLMWVSQSVSRLTTGAASGVEYCQPLPHEGNCFALKSLATRGLQVHCLSNV